jgi:hypothetical protein
MRTSNWFKILLIPVMIVLWEVAACARRPVSAGAGLPECPHDWQFGKIRITMPDSNRPAPLNTLDHTGTQLTTSGLQTNVPEFNDCQRLVIGTGTSAKYDALYAVFARDSMDIDSVGIKNLIENGMAVPMVEILSIGGTYHQLSIRPGFSCLYIYRQPGNWGAKMASFGADEQDCHAPRPVSALSSLPGLSIKRTSYPGLTWNDYPGVARWDWDVVSNTQVIGFKCLDGWCEAGEDGHPVNTGPPLATTGLRNIHALANSPVLKVKGWYDEQRLSPTTAHWWSNGLGPRPVVGWIVPVPGLDQLNPINFAIKWDTIAYVNLSEPSDEYRKQQGFTPMTAGSVTTISLCVEDWGGPDPLPTGEGCAGISKERREAAKCDPEASNPTTHWWAMTLPAGGAHPRYWCIVRRSVDGVPVPGTARWRWLASDETTWGRCGGACCSGQ